jgi:hypothetical protein
MSPSLVAVDLDSVCRLVESAEKHLQGHAFILY